MRRLALILAIFLLPYATVDADPAVLSAQKKLKTMGYYHGNLDGTYGSQTAAAIRRFQLAESLRVTGQLNAQTLAKLGIQRSRNR